MSEWLGDENAQQAFDRCIRTNYMHIKVYTADQNNRY